MKVLTSTINQNTNRVFSVSVGFGSRFVVTPGGLKSTPAKRAHS